MKLLPIFLVLIILSGCSHEVNTGYRKITPREAQAMMHDDVIILDVRTEEEYAEGHIPHAVLLADYDIKEHAATVIADKNQTILVYCKGGSRSEKAAKELIDMGYTEVFDFGGIVDWEGEIVKIP
ncbi:MAG: rhodanese-like domain-containing protein [Clostridiales bacterium]|nr:rhodanese-like domain-containing protein [Clostridiales bacterium]